MFRTYLFSTRFAYVSITFVSFSLYGFIAAYVRVDYSLSLLKPQIYTNKMNVFRRPQQFSFHDLLELALGILGYGI